MKTFRQLGDKFTRKKCKIFTEKNVKFLQSKQEFPEGCRIYNLRENQIN